MTAPLGPRDGGLRQGDCIEHFRIEAKIGQGGMGVVYRAIDERLCRLVALKVLPALAGDDPERRKRVLREARAAGAVTHANIATIYEVGEVDGRIFIAMELVEGRTLRKVMEAEPLSVQAALRIARRVGLGLAKAHDRGIVHRDLKPDNLFVLPGVGGGDFVKIVDFGIAKVAGQAQAFVTNAGAIFGTPHYMSPEQASGEAVDHRADIYALGVILFELLVGDVPFTADLPTAVLTQHVAKEPPRPTSLVGAARCPPRLEAIVLRCLAKRPADRFASVAELGGELVALLGELAAAADLRPSAVSATPAPLPLVAPPPPPRAEVSARPSRSAVGFAIAIGVAVALASSAVVLRPSARADAAGDERSAVAHVAPPAPLASAIPVAVAAIPETALAYRGAEVVPLPATILVESGQPVELELRAEGYESARVVLDGRASRSLVRLRPAATVAPSATAPPASSAPRVLRPKPAGDLIDPRGQ